MGSLRLASVRDGPLNQDSCNSAKRYERERHSRIYPTTCWKKKRLNSSRCYRANAPKYPASGASLSIRGHSFSLDQGAVVAMVVAVIVVVVAAAVAAESFD